MTREQMEQKLKDIKLMEMDLMRSLTPEEEELMLNEGYQALLNKLGFDDKDYKTLRRIEALISAFCTENEDRYEEELNKDNEAAQFVLQSIVNDLKDKEAEKLLEKNCTKIGDETELGTHCKVTSNSKNCSEDNDEFDGLLKPEVKPESIESIIDRAYNKHEDESIIDKLISGEKLKLFPWEIEEVFSYLDKNDLMYRIKINNGEVSLKLL